MYITNFSVYAVGGVLGAVGIIVALIVSVGYCQKSSKCCFKNRNPVKIKKKRSTVSMADSVGGTSETTPSRPYAVLDDHLHLVHSPTHSIASTSRPITAHLRLRTPSIPQPERNAAGLTLEFLPDDNTIILIESSDRKVTRITRTKIIIEEKLREVRNGDHIQMIVQKGILNDLPVCVFSFNLSESNFERVKQVIMEKDKSLERLTAHPRFIRYLGTCFNASKLEAYVITDLVAGCTIKEMLKNPEMRSLLDMTEEEKVQAAADLADAIYFLHGHSKAIVHGGIDISSVMIDGETHRGKLMAKQAVERIDELTRLRKKSFGMDLHFDQKEYQEYAPEVLLSEENDESSIDETKSDIWATGATIVQLLFEQSVWDEHALFKQFVGPAGEDPKEAIKQAMRIKQEPSIIKTLKSATPRLHFLSDCLLYNPLERPAATFLTRGLQQCVMESKLIV